MRVPSTLVVCLLMPWYCSSVGAVADAVCNSSGECSSLFTFSKGASQHAFDPLSTDHSAFTPSTLKRLRVSKVNRLRPNPAAVAGRSKKKSLRTEVYSIADFLSHKESLELIALHEQRKSELTSTPKFCFESLYTLQRHMEDVGLPFQNIGPSSFINESDLNISTTFYATEVPFAKVLEERIMKATKLKPEHGGKFMLTSYTPGIGYRTHHDCRIHGGSPVDRFATVLVYLNSIPAEEGGQTVFPALDINVAARQGRMLAWNNMDRNGRCLPDSVHFAEDVDKDSKLTKYILQRWYYYQTFPGLGLRFREPPVPKRSPQTAQVFCDDYDTGSCRQYDEWTSNHLIAWRHAQP